LAVRGVFVSVVTDYFCENSNLKRQFTLVIEKLGKWYVAFVEEIPGVNTWGRTLSEVRRNLKDALTLVNETNKELAARENGAEVVREEIVVNV
jgi:predicted RNase H-like HicB family nuclease